MRERRRGPAGGREATLRDRARRSRRGRRSRAVPRRPAAACETPGRTRGCGTCGSRSRRGASGESRRRGARPRTPAGRGGTRGRLDPEGARCPRYGTAPRARQRGRTGGRARARRAPRVRPPRARPRSEERPFESEQPALEAASSRPVPAELERLALPGRDDAMTGDDEREPVGGAERAGGASRAWPTGERREPAVGDDLAPPERARRAEKLALERRSGRCRRPRRRRRRPASPRGGPRFAGTDPARTRHSSVTGWPLA